ncbi:MAG: hypothetical protein IIT42_01705 [Clostridia bacterium]|nr:hypothetical protein [Clostridia bacterium]
MENKQNKNNDLSDYIANEIMDYYGEEIVSDAEKSTRPTPASPIRNNNNNKLISVLWVLCAVIFLTGALIFLGMLINSDFSKSESTSTSGSVSQKNTQHSDISSETTKRQSSDAQSETSENDSNKKLSSSTPPLVSSSDNSSFHSEIYPEIPSGSEFQTESSTVSEKEINSDTECPSDSEPDFFDKFPEENSSNNTSVPSVQKSTNDKPYRVDYFSLPEYPDDNGYIAADNTNLNNSSVNPYDNVTTGKRVRAGIGILLMTLSLVSAFAVGKLKYQEYKN